MKGRRTIALGDTISEATLYERDRLEVGATIEGPAIVEQFDATTLIPPGWRGRVDGFRNLMLTRM
jgi:N-methylhydantoinase A